MELQKVEFKSGKLVHIEFRKENGRISYIKIHGDFFIYPEEAINDIEQFIINKRLDTIKKELPGFIKDNNIRIIGFEIDELIDKLTDKHLC